MKTCPICSREADTYCELCAAILNTLYVNYNITQLMTMFSHIIGSKITQEITENMYDNLKSQYEAEKLKEEGKLN